MNFGPTKINGGNKSLKFVIDICQPICSECTRIALKRCENAKFPGGACPRFPYILTGIAHHIKVVNY